MAANDATIAAPPRTGFHLSIGGAALSRGVVTLWLTVIVLIPLAAVVEHSLQDGLGAFWNAISEPEAVAAIRLTLISSLIVTAINATMGTLIAWVLVRDDFRGKGIVNSLIDLPFALPTIVAGLTLLALYGPQSPLEIAGHSINVAFTTTAIVLAMLFVTLPFVVRTVQPVLLELDEEMEQAARSLGATDWQTFRRVVFPNILPGILSGVALAFAKAVGEFGSLVIITGNLPYKTQVSSVFIFSRIESGDRAGAAAVAVVLLAISFGLLLSIGAIRHYATRHDRD
jgi:sulfate transport system permease protein